MATFNPEDIKLSERQADCLVFIQQIYMSEGYIPSAEKISDVFGVSTATVKKWLESETFKYLLDRKGISAPKVSGVLSAQQLAIAELLLDLNDKRSKREKCEQVGITVNRLAVWRKDPTFIEYFQRRARDLFDGGKDIAYLSVLKNMDNGDMNATRLYLEMTGEYQPSMRHDVNLESFLASLIEILQVRIRDPELLEQLADDFDNLLYGKPVVLEQKSGLDAIPVASTLVEEKIEDKPDPLMIKPSLIDGALKFDFNSL